ncbi:ABC transporter ATP-binding protein [Pseudomonas sp. RC10]|uniref:ABC transporter ATP-binding protein n=1 Tax=Pseudomonas bambusae TaxID=3139142 RepID=UPI00313875BE
MRADLSVDLPRSPALIKPESSSTDSRTSGQIVLRDLEIAFPVGGQSVVAVQQIDLTIEPGQFVSIVGPSGCGKSTLLNAIAGFVTPTRGAITLDGRAVSGPGPERGVVFQQYSLFPWLTVRGNVEYGLRMRGMASEERHQRSTELLQRCGLADFASHFPEQLSGGMRQRVSIVRALANEPQVLLLDEPFGALDAQTRVIMQEVLLEMWQRSRISVLFITHDIEESVFLSDRVYAMSARPGAIKAALDIKLPRPRVHDMLLESDGLEHVRQLRRLIREEGLKSMGLD